VSVPTPEEVYERAVAAACDTETQKLEFQMYWCMVLSNLWQERDPKLSGSLWVTAAQLLGVIQEGALLDRDFDTIRRIGRSVTEGPPKRFAAPVVVVAFCAYYYHQQHDKWPSDARLQADSGKQWKNEKGSSMSATAYKSARRDLGLTGNLPAG
jgi:hypothetical protein